MESGTESFGPIINLNAGATPRTMHSFAATHSASWGPAVLPLRHTYHTLRHMSSARSSTNMSERDPVNRIDTCVTV